MRFRECLGAFGLPLAEVEVTAPIDHLRRRADRLTLHARTAGSALYDPQLSLLSMPPGNCPEPHQTWAMINLYPHYKPFRNYMRRFALIPSLLQLWGYVVHVTENGALPADLASGKPPRLDLKGHLHAWDLEILVREVILNAGKTGSDGLSQWSGLACAVNHVRELEGVPYAGSTAHADVMIDLQRMAHRQFRWQSGGAKLHAHIVRAWKIFGGPELDAKVSRQIGMDMGQLLRLGMAVTGGLLSRPVLHLGTDFSSIGIPLQVSRPLLERLTCDLPELQERVDQSQQYNDAWLYASFPLEHTPLIRVDPNRPDQVLCPIPRYLLNRVTSGVFYDIINSDGFANDYGDAFQRYVGEVIGVTLNTPGFRVIDERPYAESKATLKHGADWIVSDSTGHLFIECKTKRLSLGAKNVTDPAAVNRDVAAMTKAIVQNYKNILDAKKGITVWQPDDLPVYPVIVTLEDWHLFSTHFTDMLHGEVRNALGKEGIDADIASSMPYTVTSVSELETALQVVSQLNIAEVFAKKTAPDHWTWAWTGFLANHFPKALSNAKALLFPGDAQRLLTRSTQVRSDQTPPCES